MTGTLSRVISLPGSPTGVARDSGGGESSLNAPAAPAHSNWDEEFPKITPYRPLWEDEEDKGWAFAVIVSCVTLIGMVVYAATLRLLFGG